ncbi:MAG: NUDIX domain-containing protein [Planctomycetota bacterium]
MSGAKPPEFVWVVRRRDLFPEFCPQGFLVLESAELESRYLMPARERGFFVERREAETCPAWKQLVPYCLLRFEGRFLLTQRLPAQSEARLHGRYSLGIGGHVNPPDLLADADPFRVAARRELHEELLVEGELDLRPLGILNDDSNPVGAVHLGLVYGVTVSGPEPRIRETEKLQGTLTPLAELRDMCQTPRPFESWTRRILEAPGWDVRF